MTDTLAVFVPGRPVPQGSKRHVGNGVMIESAKDLKPWRESIRASLLTVWRERTLDGRVTLLPQLQGGVRVALVFVMPRPVSTPKRRTPQAIKKPDTDKLARAVLDAIGSAGVWRDDSQVIDLHAQKRLAEIGEPPGCWITIEPVQEVAA